MRILFVPNDFPSAARPQMGIFILRRIQAIAALGHDVSVLVPVPLAPPIGSKWRTYNNIPSHEIVEGIPVHAVRVPTPPRFIGAEYMPLLMGRALDNEISRFRPDIVHASYLLPSGQVTVRQRRVPSIVTTHGYDAYDLPNRRRGLHRACVETVSKATRVTAVSGYLAQCLQRLVRRPIDVIWNGADERYFFPQDRAACRAELGLPPGRVIVAYAGFLLREKGLFELLHAFARIPAEERPLLVLAGDGDARAQVEAEANSLRLEVRFFGALPHDRIGVVFGAADIVTLPSYYEGLPNVICEAMLSERAVVATDVGGIPEIVRNGETGLIVPARNVEDLAGALKRCASEAALRRRLSMGARHFAEQHLTWRRSATHYEALYREVLDQRTNKDLFAAGHPPREVSPA
jgi:glycosyltransferase involved in cell wall biosynthesis